MPITKQGIEVDGKGSVVVNGAMVIVTWRGGRQHTMSWEELMDSVAAADSRPVISVVPVSDDRDQT